MSVGLQVIGDYLHQFKLFAKEVTRSSFRTSEVLVANNVVLGQNIKALNDHLISTTIDLDPSERKAIKDASRLCDLLRRPNTHPFRRLKQRMELSYKAIRELGQKYHVPMDWSGYVESTSTDALTTSSMQKLTSDTTSDTQDSEATSSLNISVDPSDTTNTDVLICIWDRCSRGPEVISYLDQPSYQTIKAYSGRTSINKLLMDLEDDGRFLFRRRYQCYSLRDQEHDYTDPALRWSPKDETRRIASLPKLKGFTTIHIIQDVNFFLLFILHVQPSQPARGIVVGMKNEKDAYVVEEYLLQGLRLTKGEFHYQEIKGDHRLQLTGCQLEPFSCDWCILHGRPNLDS